MAKQRKNLSKSNKPVYIQIIMFLLFTLIIALIIGLIKQANIISKYELIGHLDNQACRYLSERGDSAQVNGGFVLNTDANANEAKLTYYCYTGETTKDKTIHGKPIDSYSLGATVLYFSSNSEAEQYAKEKLNPLRYWSEDGSNKIQDKNYTFLVTDEEMPYFDAYRVRANAVVRVSLKCENKNLDSCNIKANQLLDQELKGINAL